MLWRAKSGRIMSTAYLSILSFSLNKNPDSKIIECPGHDHKKLKGIETCNILTKISIHPVLSSCTAKTASTKAILAYIETIISSRHVYAHLSQYNNGHGEQNNSQNIILTNAE